MNKLLLFACVIFNYTYAFKLTVIHNNDIHSHFAETTVSGGVCTDKDRNEQACVGGTARLVSKVSLSMICLI